MKGRQFRPRRARGGAEGLSPAAEPMDRALEPLGERAPADGRDSALRETPTHFVCTARLPGFDKKDVEVEATAGRLTVRARRSTQRETGRRHVRGKASVQRAFERTVALPAPVRPAEVKARFREGLLTIELPKARPGDARRVAID